MVKAIVAFNKSQRDFIAKSHIIVWINSEDVDDVGIVIASRADADRIYDVIDEAMPDDFLKLVAAIEKEKIPHIVKTWDEKVEDDGFSVFEYPESYEDDDGCCDEDGNEDGNEDGEEDEDEE